MKKKMDANTSPDDEIVKARRLLAEDHKRKMEACMLEIQKALDKYGFDLAVSNPSITLVSKGDASLENQ